MHRQKQDHKGPAQMNHPFAKLQKILEKQKTRPLRSSPPKNQTPNLLETGLVLNRRKVENHENPIKRMFPEKGIATGYTWEDMIRRTSDEKIVNMRVNISEARAFFPDSKRCTNPEFNAEVEPTRVERLPANRAEQLKHGSKNLIAGQSMSAIDERVRNKRNWKVGLINKFENNQDMWGDLTNSFVNKLKEEAHYDPAQDFVKENGVINEKLARKLEIMENQCLMHKENMKNNPITGNRNDNSSVSRRKTSEFGLEQNKSDIHSIRNSEATRPREGRHSHTSQHQSSRMGGSTLRSSVQEAPTRKHRQKWEEESRSQRPSYSRSQSTLSSNWRNNWGQ